MRIIDLADRTPAQKQGLLSQLVVPRPIAMITTLDAKGGVNVAPFSYYMPVSGEPPLVAITVGSVREATDEPKDSWVNLNASGEFVINVTTTALADHIETVAREYPAGVDEADLVGWRTVPSQVVRPPSLADSPAHLECRVREVIDRGDSSSCFSGVHIVLAEVVCITVDESIMASPTRIDPTKVHAVGRMGFPWFVAASPESIFNQDRIAYADLPGGEEVLA
ncbi:flavin reductase family protein [Streptosporangium amethystogenes]|uniref:flavin reductase family protein n=1 Tax=Streptosporangium amethystogenes TaxID=2002 RepID=UPI0006896E3D|nr:flavin reductase family protein [Streptosporangium amethystogenes]